MEVGNQSKFFGSSFVLEVKKEEQLKFYVEEYL